MYTFQSLLFPLFCLIVLTESFHVPPSFSPHHPKPDYVCATFPFCYQQLGTGAWKSMPGTSQLNTTETSALPRDVPAECWIDGYYCRSDASNLITHIQLDSAEECQKDASKRSLANSSAYTTLVGRVIALF